MDELFLIFEKWYISRSADWIDKGITVDEAGLGIWGHQYWIKLHSDYGIGNIVLYESKQH